MKIDKTMLTWWTVLIGIAVMTAGCGIVLMFQPQWFLVGALATFAGAVGGLIVVAVAVMTLLGSRGKPGGAAKPAPVQVPMTESLPHVKGDHPTRTIAIVLGLGVLVVLCFGAVAWYIGSNYRTWAAMGATPEPLETRVAALRAQATQSSVPSGAPTVAWGQSPASGEASQPVQQIQPTATLPVVGGWGTGQTVATKPAPVLPNAGANTNASSGNAAGCTADIPFCYMGYKAEGGVKLGDWLMAELNAQCNAGLTLDNWLAWWNEHMATRQEYIGPTGYKKDQNHPQDLRFLLGEASCTPAH